MGSIRTAIELQDNFTGIMMNIINAVNLSVSTMQQMQETMSSSIDTTSIEGIRNYLNQATIAAQQLGAAMQNVKTSTPDVSSQDQPQWQSYKGLEVFTSTGAERFEQEISSVNSMMERLSNTQYKITQQSNESTILSPQAAYDIQNVENRMSQLSGMIEQVKNNPLNVGNDSANAELERLREQLNQTLTLQANLNQAMQGMDTGEINEAYLQLSQSIRNTEKFVRDSFSNIPPVEVPITWSSNNVEVFTGSGIERFEQEVQSANHMLATLNQTQAQIAAKAAQTNIFPPNMVTDMNGMQNRLQAIQSRIQAIQSNPLNVGSDRANAELERLRGQLQQAVQQQELMNQAVENMDVQAANEAYLRLCQIVGNTERHIRDNTDEQGRFNDELERGTNKANDLMKTIKRVVAAYATIQTFSSSLDLSDQLTSTTARLNLMNDGLQSTQDLQNMIYLSAERARGSYQATADAVSKLGLMAGDAFSSSEEIVAFMEQVNKQFTIAGTEASGIDAAMLQLTQAMGSGVLRGEEYNSILEQAPNIIQAIADYMEVPKGKLKDMAAEGKITADIVKAAMFAVADETNAKFEQMPQTFEQIWTSFQNTAITALQPLLENLNEIANSAAFQEVVSHASSALSKLVEIVNPIIDKIANSQVLWVFVNGLIDGITTGLQYLLGFLSWLVEGALNFAQVIIDNWSWISPIIYGIIGALALYGTYLAITKAIELASTAVKVIITVAQYAYAAATRKAVSETTKQTAAQLGLNTALLACPITWIVVAIIILITVIYAVVGAINHFKGTSISATGAVMGAFAVLGAAILNTFVIPVWNKFAALANFFGNLFNDPIASIKVLFYDMCLSVIGYIQKMAHAIENLINKIPGITIDITSGLDNFYSQLEQAQQAVKDESGWVEYVKKLDYIDYEDAWNSGYAFGEKIDETIGEFDPSSLFKTDDISSAKDFANSGIGSGVDDIATNTGVIADSMDITEEELKYLRDIAEQETVNRFTTAEIKIEQTNHNTISNDIDLDGFVISLTEAVNEAAETMAEGVHV